MDSLSHYVPPEVIKILMVLALALLLGLERETRKVNGSHYYFGGIATFPLIGLIGFAAAVLSSTSLIPVGFGLALIGGFLLISYRHKLSGSKSSGFVTELAGITAYLQGALVYFGHYWIATTLVVLNLIILNLKDRLEDVTQKMPSEETFTLGRFLFLTAVILPIVPNEEFTEFQLNPFKIWLVVVVVSALSYFGYLLQRLLKERGGVLISALVGGTYSSGAVTVTLAKRSRETHTPNLYTGGVLIACGLMFLRVLVLLSIFDRSLMRQVLFPLLVLGIGTMSTGYLWSRISDAGGKKHPEVNHWKNPLELMTALFFAAIFVIVLIGNHLVVKYFGITGIYYLAAFIGSMDVDPFVIGLTQSSSQAIPMPVAATAVLIAVSGNNLIKGVYALIFGEKKMGRQTAAALGLVTAGGLAAIYFVW